jgi:carbamoyl-phosphate synthase small subunit
LKNKPVLSVQFHPEASPGPHDAHDIFGEFFGMVNEECRIKNEEVRMQKSE